MGKECYIMARPCFVLFFLRFLRSRSFFLLYLLYTYKYIKRMLNTVVNYFHSLWLASCGLAAAMLDSQAKIRRTPATKEDRPTSNSLSVSLSRRKPRQQNKKEMRAKQQFDFVLLLLLFHLMEFDLRPLEFCISNWVKCVVFFVFLCFCVNETATKRRAQYAKYK